MRAWHGMRRRMLLHALVIVTGASIGAIVASASTPTAARAEGACENDLCSEVCSFGNCSGNCFDAPESRRSCDMIGDSCAVSSCDQT